jgi:hypothetical protein
MEKMKRDWPVLGVAGSLFGLTLLAMPWGLMIWVFGILGALAWWWICFAAAYWFFIWMKYE